MSTAFRREIVGLSIVLFAESRGAEEPDFKILDVFACKLRKRLMVVCGENYIETHRRRGYLLRAPGTGEPIDSAKAA